jgi:hypothetical protein
VYRRLGTVEVQDILHVIRYTVLFNDVELSFVASLVRAGAAGAAD